MKEKYEVYLDSNMLQKDMRIRIPKQVLQNLNVIAGETVFDIYLNLEDECLVLREIKSKKEK